jgi:hypothetical protein
MTSDLETPPSSERLRSLRRGRHFTLGAGLLGAGVAVLVLSILSPRLPLLVAFTGVFGWIVGLALVGGGVCAWTAPSRLDTGWRWFRAFRRTRPFWGGFWLLLSGWAILRLSMTSAHIVVVAGLTGFGGWLTGGGIVLCAFAAWAAPSQRYVVGVVALILAVSALIVSNLGGLGIGTLCGVVGGAMTLAWGPKKPAGSRGPRRTRVGLLGLEGAPTPAPPVRPRPMVRPSPTSRPDTGSVGDDPRTPA